MARIVYSYEQVGNLLDDKEVALAEFLIALFKHKMALPHYCSFPHSQCLNHILILPNSLAQQGEAHLLSTGLAEHHQTLHPNLINIDVQQLLADLVPGIEEVKKCPKVAQEKDLLQSKQGMSYVRLYRMEGWLRVPQGSKVSMYSSSRNFSQRMRVMKLQLMNLSLNQVVRYSPYLQSSQRLAWQCFTWIISFSKRLIFKFYQQTQTVKLLRMCCTVISWRMDLNWEMRMSYGVPFLSQLRKWASACLRMASGLTVSASGLPVILKQGLSIHVLLPTIISLHSSESSYSSTDLRVSPFSLWNDSYRLATLNNPSPFPSAAFAIYVNYLRVTNTLPFYLDGPTSSFATGTFFILMGQGTVLSITLSNLSFPLTNLSSILLFLLEKSSTISNFTGSRGTPFLGGGGCGGGTGFANIVLK